MVPTKATLFGLDVRFRRVDQKLADEKAACSLKNRGKPREQIQNRNSSLTKAHTTTMAFAKRSMQKSQLDQNIHKYKSMLKQVDNSVKQKIKKEQSEERQKMFSAFEDPKEVLEKQEKEQLQVIKKANLFSEALYYQKVEQLMREGKLEEVDPKDYDDDDPKTQKAQKQKLYEESLRSKMSLDEKLKSKLESRKRRKIT